jgi:hypothetical protein
MHCGRQRVAPSNNKSLPANHPPSPKFGEAARVSANDFILMEFSRRFAPFVGSALRHLRHLTFGLRHFFPHVRVIRVIRGSHISENFGAPFPENA